MDSIKKLFFFHKKQAESLISPCFFNCKMRDLVGRAEGRLTLGAVVVDGEEGVGRRGEVGVNTLG